MTSSKAEKTHGPIIQERDTQLFLGLLESRMMTRDHIAKLYFAGSYEMAKKRLAKLIQASFVLERKPQATPGQFFPATLYLGRKGFDVLHRSAQLAAFPKITWDDVVDRVAMAHSTLAHELELIDHKVVLTSALRASPAGALVEFFTWPALYQFRTENREQFLKKKDREPEKKKFFVLKPDAFFMARAGDDSDNSFYLEYDRATEAGPQLMKKAWGYHHHYISGGFAERNGAPPTAYKEYPFRVLYVLPSEERRNAIAERLLQVKHLERHSPVLLKNQHWLTTSAAFLADPLGAIWLTLGDYWRATEGTIYDPRQHVTTHRVSARDRLIATRAALQPLFTIQQEEAACQTTAG